MSIKIPMTWKCDPVPSETQLVAAGGKEGTVGGKNFPTGGGSKGSNAIDWQIDSKRDCDGKRGGSLLLAGERWRQMVWADVCHNLLPPGNEVHV